MSEEIDKEADQTAEEVQGPRCGECLKQARREKQISVLEIAKELHLDEHKVRALERNDFEVLGAPVFAKGHLRKYAELVGLDTADILADYYELDREGPAPLVITPRIRPRRELTPGPWIAVIVVLVVVAAAYWWFVARAPETVTLPEPVVETAVPEEPADTPIEQTPAAEPEVETQVEIPELEETAAPVEEPDDGQVRLVVTYSGDCWTEISDAGGNRLFFDLGKSGRTINVSGEAPLNILFGDAANVMLQVDGVERPISSSERRGKTARLTIRP
jgi:cytoskeleton protein RodZ